MNFNFSKQNYLSVGDGWLDGSKSLSGILGSRNTLSLCEQSEQGGSKFTERKNPYTAVYGAINFDPNYLRTGKTEWAKKNLGHVQQKPMCQKFYLFEPKSGRQNQLLTIYQGAHITYFRAGAEQEIITLTRPIRKRV